MKKLLLLAASALLGVSSAFAQYYVAGGSISDPDDIQDDAVYFLHAIQPARGNQGYVQGYENLQDQTFAKFGGGLVQSLPTEGLDPGKIESGVNNTTYLWQLQRITEGEYAGNFVIKLYGADRWFSKMGSVAVGKNKTQKVNSRDDANIGIYALEKPTESIQGDNKFWFRLNNAFPATVDNNVLAAHKICMRSNNSGSTEFMAYWHTDESSKAFYVQFEIIEAIEKNTPQRTVTVTLPAINGWPVQNLSLELHDGQNALITIKNKLTELGGMANAVITSAKEDDSENMTVAEDNTQFTVSGNWDRELIANHVYRVTMKPGDRPAAMRYELLSHNINTISGYNESGEPNSLSRLVPERLWFFKPVEGKDMTYTLHTLYDVEKGIYIADDGEASSLATLSDDEHPATEFKVNKSTWNASNGEDNYVGDFYLTYGTNNGLNERNNYVGQWKNGGWAGDHGSAFRLTPLSSDDLSTLGLDDGTETTIDKVFDAVAEFNGTNVNAALRRIKYMNANDADMFGTLVGQYNNEKGNASELYDQAVAIVNGQEATDEEKQAIVDGLDPTKLIFKDLMPNRFYRFKNKQSGKYISSISTTTVQGKKYMDLTDDGTRSNTVFLYHQDGEGDDAVNTLVCFDNGLVMPSFGGTQWVPVLKTDSDAAQGTHLTYQDNGRYIIHVSNNDKSGHRHLYGGADTASGSAVDAANNQTGVQYQWYVEEVEFLPITFYNVVDDDPDHGDDGWASVYAPVALTIPAGSHITAYTGKFVSDVDTENGEIQHIFATAIEANEDKSVTIPANQVALLYYDGGADIDADPDYDHSAMQATRGDIIYAYIPIDYSYDGTPHSPDNGGGLNASIFAIAQEENQEYYTLHASYNNYFRQLNSYKDGQFDYVPGFKAHLAVAPDDVEYYQLSTINPNEMVPVVEGTEGTEGITCEKSGEQYQVVITTPSADYVVYYKHTPAEAAEPKSAPRKVAPATQGEYDLADKDGNEHTVVVNNPGTLEYYAYHEATNTTGAVRSFDVTADGPMPTGIKSVTVNFNGKQVVFDLMGRRQAKPVKGINIINGTKVIK